MKYCPNCLKECSVSQHGGFACDNCGILQYCTGILLDEPNTEKQKDYKLRKILKQVIHPSIREEGLENIIIDIEKLFSNYYEKTT